MNGGNIKIKITPNINNPKITDPTWFKNTNLKNIETVINIIASKLCKDKSSTFNIDDIKKEITKEFKDASNNPLTFEQICLSQPLTGPNCNNGEILFTDDFIGKVAKKINENSKFRRICKFKKNVVYGRIDIDPWYIGPWGRLYVDGGYDVVRHRGLPLFRHRGLPFALPGGGSCDTVPNSYNKQVINHFIEDDRYVLGHYMDENKNMNPITYINFNEFLKNYEDYHKPNMDMDTEEYSVNTNGINKKLEDAYYLTKILSESKNINDKLNELELLLDFLEFFIVPLKTLEKSNIVQKKMKHSYAKY